MNTKYSFAIASALHEEFERMAEIPVNISSTDKNYHICGDGFLATVEARELDQLCPNKRIVGKVVSTDGQTPIFVGENVQMIFLEKGKSKVKILLDSMSPEMLVKRFLREGEINEAQRIIRKKENLLKAGLFFGFLVVAAAAILGGMYDTWKPAFFIVILVVLFVVIDKIYNKQLKEVLD
ncbi:MAG: hypothetical protein KBF62_02870 [Candidatus Pacebacteria bacterium]|nr:hypothetical protein [Candidatus Paceibacterota bacterium]MBP9058556.1 hypothetical protein [Candidatus Paceibacterota bacterium]MBP9769871.1 hypothetical protein [Candidatus Paceibacterota bacterium]